MAKNANISTETRDLVESLVSAGKPYSQIAAVLLALDHAKNGKDAERILAALGVSKGGSTRRGFLDNFYAFLQEGPKTQTESWNWVRENGSKNSVRWFVTHDKVRELANQLHANLGGNEIPVNDVTNLVDQIKKIAG